MYLLLIYAHSHIHSQREKRADNFRITRRKSRHRNISFPTYLIFVNAANYISSINE